MTSDRTPRGWSLRTATTVLFAVPFALCGLLFGIFVWSARISEQGYATAHDWGQHAAAIVKLRAAAEAYVDAVSDIGATDGEQAGVATMTEISGMARIVSAGEILAGLIEHSRTLAAQFGATESAEAAELAKPLHELLRLGPSVALSGDHAKLAEFNDFFRDVIVRAANERVNEEIRSSMVAAETGRNESARITRAAIVVTLLLMVLGLAICLRFASSLRRNFGALTEAATHIAAGDLDVTFAVSGNHELRRVGDAFNSMVTRLSTTMVQRSALEAANAELASHRSDLERALEQIRTTQDELMGSSRLAAVGEMAGRTAHEVLNPAQSLHGRLSRMASDDVPGYQHNADVLGSIVDAWREAHAGGLDQLLRALAEPVGDTSALDADLAVLAELVDSNRAAATRANGDVAFLLRELDRITRIVDGMRGMTRMSSISTRQAIGPILAEAGEILRDGTAKRRIELRWSAPDDVMVELDRYELLQVLTNLIRNAWPAIEQRGGRVGGSIELCAKVHGDRLALEVRDDGGGIAPEHLPLIFEPSFTTRGAADGTGLGLSISRRLVRHMGGAITVAQTEVGHGTTFLIDLPLALPAAHSTEFQDAHDHSNAA